MNSPQVADSKKQVPRVILQVENDQDDVFFLTRAVQKAGLPHQVMTVRDGDEAIDYLMGKGAYGNRAKFPLPSVVLLDLRMPRVSGIGFLAWLRSQEMFKSLPVAVLSSSPADVDKHAAEKLGAMHYYVKPVDASQLVGILRDVDARWLQTACPDDSRLV